jgi:tetratricopeptide (TPR) repeat protein
VGIPLKDQRRRIRRRSYANYKPPSPNRGPRNDPFRIVVYIVLIAAGVWAYRNQETVSGWLFEGESLSERRQAATVADSVERPDAQTAEDDAPASNLEAQAEEAYQDGNLPQAIDLYRQAAEANPNNVNNHVQVARLLIYEAGLMTSDNSAAALDEALEAANDAVLVDPYDPAGYAIMGKVYDWQGRPDQASSTILQALDIDEDYALAHSYLAEAFVDLDRWDQAQESIEKALALQPDNVDIRRDYGYVLENLGDYAAAATQYEAALRIHPRLPYLRVALARVYRELGDYDTALNHLFEAQSAAPSNPMVAFEIGRTYETYIGDTNEALSYYERVVDLDESFGGAWQRMGSLRYFNGHYGDAIIAFEQAIALDSMPDDLLYQVGLAYAQEGRCETAQTYLDEAQAAAGENELIAEAIQSGYDICSAPTPLPSDLTGTPGLTGTPEAEATAEP